MEFKAEIIELRQKKTASLDKVYRVVLETDDAMIMALSALPADEVVTVTIEGRKE